MALERCLQKIVAHPMLYGDPDLKVFLESESFNVEVGGPKGKTSDNGQHTDIEGGGGGGDRNDNEELNRKIQK